MRDIELLELAAKAAGFNYNPQLTERESCALYGCWDDMDVCMYWTPLDDDGDALRLAIHLRMRVDITADGCLVDYNGQFVELANGDIQQATRTAIVRAAASSA